MPKAKDVNIGQDDHGRVAVTLTALGRRKLKRAKGMLVLIAKLPCIMQELASDLVPRIEKLTDLLEEPAPADIDKEKPLGGERDQVDPGKADEEEKTE